MNVAIAITFAMLALAVVLTFVRLVRGPTLPDRVVAVDLIGVLIAGIVIVASAETGHRAFLDVAIVIALISFVGTVAYSRYIEWAGRQ